MLRPRFTPLSLLKTIVEKECGFADFQLDVPTPPRGVYEIGSITKQFTAAAILLLAEDGKLSLDDELTKHLPDCPTQGHRVTIRHLLNHTSGFKSYTDLPDFRTLAVQKGPREELVMRLFDRADMKDSSYCSERQIRRKKVQGRTLRVRCVRPFTIWSSGTEPCMVAVCSGRTPTAS